MKKRGKKAVDLSGKRFGKLVVLESAKRPDEAKNRETYWLCQCDCGNTKIIRKGSLTLEGTKSCGCHKENMIYKIKDLTGEKFNRLTVIKRVVYTEGIRQGTTHWLCRCDCGKTTVVSGKSLKKGTTKSCGCYRSESFRKIFYKRTAPIIDFKKDEVQ